MNILPLVTSCALALAPAAQAQVRLGAPSFEAPETRPAEAWLIPLRGEVLLRAETEGGYRDPGASRTELRPGSVVRTGRYAAARVELSDGSFVKLSSMTALEVGNERWLRLLGGNVRVSFKRHLFKGEWKLRLPAAAVVRGTSFTIASSGKGEDLSAPAAPPPGLKSVIAQVEKVHGAVERRTFDGTKRLLGAADISPGTIIATSEASGAALRLYGNAKAKLWPGAALAFHGTTPVLLAGRLSLEGPPVSVRLPHIGGATGAFSVESPPFDEDSAEPPSCGAAVRLCGGPRPGRGGPAMDWAEGLELGVSADGVATLLDDAPQPPAAPRP